MSRHNIVGIQMLSNALRNHLFKNATKEKFVEEKVKCEIIKHLKHFKIPFDKTQTIDNIDFDLPSLNGASIAEHFANIANEQIKPYVNLANEMANVVLPPRPNKWIYKEGWTKYDRAVKLNYPVDYPDEMALVIDAETFVPTGGHPLMVTAVSPTAWYSWCSRYLFPDTTISGSPALSDLVKISDKYNLKNEALYIGHNVSFDRSLLREEYQIKPSKTNFIDTMALHIAISGFTGYQRLVHLAKKKDSKTLKTLSTKKMNKQPIESWVENSCLNNLSDVHQFYCKKEPLEKHLREIFVEGSLAKIQENFQVLMKYCSDDVKATHDVFKILWPKFRNRFPHPVTLAGMFEMGKSFLPVNKNWFKYIEKSDNKYDELQERGLVLLNGLANEAKTKIKDDSYKTDLWLWNLDWSEKSKRLRPVSPPAGGKTTLKGKTEPTPKWYLEQCELDQNNNLLLNKLTLQKRTSVKLLKLVWKGFPLHHSPLYGWGYLVPYCSDAAVELEKKKADNYENESHLFPLQRLIDYCNDPQSKALKETQRNAQTYQHEKTLFEMQSDNPPEDMDMFWEAFNNDFNKKSTDSSEELPILNVVAGCYFYRLPHKDGAGKNVGNPLSKGFHHDIDQGTMASLLGKHVDVILKQGNISAYWKNNVKRIKSQYVINLDHIELPLCVTSNPQYKCDDFYGAIIPRVVTAGTVTRRAVEPTWLTASNAYRDRIGSEFKSMVQAPSGYSLVGADVDSQELWIAALLGDAHFAGHHGCTAFGWMTLQGNKADGTDAHSRTAEMIGISREHSKIFNYGRIYGAGLKFAEQMLLKFNTTLTTDEAKTKATKMFQATKGKKSRAQLNEDGSFKESSWQGGSESYMFNKLEEIASLEHPKTPVLNASMSSSLEPSIVGRDFMTSRINWVVQSSAVDYLHLMLVCMKWLFEKYDISGRFCISIHDEVRYLVTDSDKYRAALALQITNLFTRSMFAHQLQFNDLPQSVAFFSSVEIDKCMRKDAQDDCVTPSNDKGLREEYGIPAGESLTIADILVKTGGKLTGPSSQDQKGDVVIQQTD